MGGGGSKEDKKLIFKQYAKKVTSYLDILRLTIDKYKDLSGQALPDKKKESFKQTLYIPGIDPDPDPGGQENFGYARVFIPPVVRLAGYISSSSKKNKAAKAATDKKSAQRRTQQQAIDKKKQAEIAKLKKAGKLAEMKCAEEKRKAQSEVDTCVNKAKTKTFFFGTKSKRIRDERICLNQTKKNLFEEAERKCSEIKDEEKLTNLKKQSGTIDCPPCYQKAEKTYHQIVNFVQTKMIVPFLHKDENTEFKWGEMTKNQSIDMLQKGEELFKKTTAYIERIFEEEGVKWKKGAILRAKLEGIRLKVKNFFGNLLAAKSNALKMYKDYIKARTDRRKAEDKALEKEKKAEIKAEQNKYRVFLKDRYEWYKNLIYKLKDPDFNCGCYLDRYPDLRKEFENDCTQAAQHWEKKGRKENRIGICKFECKCYLDRYSDLKKQFGENCDKAKQHWIAGKKSAKATCDITKEEREAMSKARNSYIIFLTWATKRFEWAMSKIIETTELKSMRFFFTSVHGPVYEKWKEWWAKAKQYLSKEQLASLQSTIDRHEKAQAKAKAYIAERKKFWKKRALRIKIMKAKRIFEDWLPVIILVSIILIGVLIYFGKQYGWFDPIILWFSTTFAPVTAWFSATFGPVFAWLSATFAPVSAWFSAIFAWFGAIFAAISAWFSSIFAPVSAWFSNLFGSDNNEVEKEADNNEVEKEAERMEEVKRVENEVTSGGRKKKKN